MWTSQRARGGLRLLLQEHLPHTWGTGAGGVSPCNSISKVVKNLDFSQKSGNVRDSIWRFCKIKIFLFKSSLAGMNKLGSAGHPPYGHCEGRHSGDGVDPIRYVLVFVARILPFVSPDLYCSCSQNINLSLIYFPLMSQRKYWGLRQQDGLWAKVKAGKFLIIRCRPVLFKSANPAIINHPNPRNIHTGVCGTTLKS